MAGSKGNKNAVGNNGGKPPFYDTPEEMQAACDAYFAKCIEDKEPATITGLTLALGFCTRKSLLDYSEKIEFVNIIKKAKLKVEHEYEKALRTDRNATGAIFVLKNMEWSDKQEIENNINLPQKIKGITFKE
jgi:hypothetical protein